MRVWPRLLFFVVVVDSLMARAAERPVTRVDNVADSLHGNELVDPYRWLEDQGSPETRAWIDAQNAYTNAVLATSGVKQGIERRVAELLRTDVIGMPMVRGNWYFYSKRTADQNLMSLMVKQGRDGPEEVLVDPHRLSDDHTTSVSFMDVSQDGRLLAYAVRQGGEDEISIQLLDVETRKLLPDTLPRARYFGVALLPDKSGFYYTRYDSQGPRVFFHALGTAADEDQAIFGKEYGPGEIVGIELSEDGRYLLMTAFFGSAAEKTEIFLLDRDQNGSILPVVKGIKARFTASFADQRLILHTNWEAPNGRVLATDIRSPEPSNWQEIFRPENAVLQNVAAVGGKLFLNLLENVQYRVAIHEATGEHVGEIPFPTLGTVSGIRGQWSANEAFFEFTSFLVPPTIYEYQVSEGRQNVWSRSAVPFDDKPFELKQIWITSKDGTKVPMFLLARKDRAEDVPLPTLLTGYGGFNLSITPRFSALAAIWVENGGAYAVPSLRGGGEFGETWHEAGTRERKQNVFDDFLAAAEWLIDQKLTSPEKLSIAGGSNGGLLVGAALTQRPELFRAVVCSYPLLDMVRYHRFLVARFWVPEYGSSEDAEQFKTLLAYSPYHHVKEGVEYPAVLFVTGDADTRVDPLHARKMTALLQAATASTRPVLLHYDTKSGHSGGKPTSKAIEDLSLELTFLFSQLGVTPTEVVRQNGSGELHDLFQAEWEYTLRERPTFASYLGDKRYNDRWPDVSLSNLSLHAEHVRDVLKRLEQFDPDHLGPMDKLNLQLFRKKYQSSAEGDRYRGYLLPLDQRGGIQTADELADSLSFQTVKDFEDWIARLRGLSAYIARTTDLMREGIRTGRVHPKVIMKRVPDQISAQIVKDPAASPFMKPFAKFPDAIPADERVRLTEQAKTVIKSQVVPAYETFLSFFNKEYLPACTERVGIWQFPQGEEMYAFLARDFTTTELSPQAIHKIGLREVERIHGEMEAIIQRVGFQGSFAEFLDSLRTDPRFYYTDGASLLEGYRSLSKRIDPTLVKLFQRLPRMPYGVEPIPNTIAPDTTTAYYRGPAADGSRAGTYFVNLFRPETRPKYEMEALSLHEAVPGHHLQIALAMELGELPPFRRHGGYTAFVEGWGLYAESLGTELGFYQDPYSKFGQLTYEMWRAVRLVVDTGMHALGWSREQAIDFFKANAAKSELDMTNEIDRYIAWPGQALAYKIGELKIKELRARASLSLGSRFDIREFHEVVLGSGAVPLDVLEANVNAWIASK